MKNVSGDQKKWNKMLIKNVVAHIHNKILQNSNLLKESSIWISYFHDDLDCF